jgi:hypothetical protein
MTLVKIQRNGSSDSLPLLHVRRAENYDHSLFLDPLTPFINLQYVRIVLAFFKIIYLEKLVSDTPYILCHFSSI